MDDAQIYLLENKITPWGDWLQVKFPVHFDYYPISQKECN